MKNPYLVLDVEQSASQNEIKRSFRKKAMKCHPDQADEMSREKAKSEFLKIKEAFEIIGDEKKREAFDKGMSIGNGDEDQNQNEWEEFVEKPDMTLKNIAIKVTEGMARLGISAVKGWFLFMGRSIKNMFLGAIFSSPVGLAFGLLTKGFEAAALGGMISTAGVAMFLAPLYTFFFDNPFSDMRNPFLE